MKHTNVNKIIDFLGWAILLINIVIAAVIVYAVNNPIIVVYKMIFVGFLGINSIFLLLISIFRKKKIVLVNIFVIVVIFFVAKFIKPSVSEDEIWEYRNKIVQEIESGNYEVHNGVIDLPNEDIYERVSDTKRVVLTKDGDRAVIYFYENAGMLEESCGYIYYSDKVNMNNCNDSYEFINKEHIKGKWYSCSTR